jgi:Zn ribbon nucleic-acid-binding protein
LELEEAVCDGCSKMDKINFQNDQPLPTKHVETVQRGHEPNRKHDKNIKKQNKIPVFRVPSTQYLFDHLSAFQTHPHAWSWCFLSLKNEADIHICSSRFACSRFVCIPDLLAIFS